MLQFDNLADHRSKDLHWARADSSESADLESLGLVVSNIGKSMENDISGRFKD